MASASRLSAGTVPTLVLAAALVSASATAVAQGRPLRLIVPFPPGPGVDMIARTVSDQLSQTMGRTVVVDNRPGAGSVIGVDLAAKSPADGNTLLFANLAYAINAAMVANLPYDPLRDLAPVTVVATQPHLLVVNPAVPVKTVRDLIALAKGRPGEITYASAGVGTGPQLVAEMFSRAVGVRMNHIPYKGANPALSDVVGGHAQVMFATLVSSLPQVQAGRLRAVALCGTSYTTSQSVTWVEGRDFTGWERPQRRQGQDYALLARGSRPSQCGPCGRPYDTPGNGPPTLAELGFETGHRQQNDCSLWPWPARRGRGPLSWKRMSPSGPASQPWELQRRRPRRRPRRRKEQPWA